MRVKFERDGEFMIQIFVFVPETHVEELKNSMFDAGCGKIGNYDHCCFMHSGLGQFRPLKGSQAYLGKVGEVETVNELKIEMTCEDTLFEKIILAMKQAHPYETP